MDPSLTNVFIMVCVEERCVLCTKILVEIHKDVVFQGIKRIYEDMPDICIDVPTAYSLLERFGNKMFDMGILNEELAKDMPNR